MARHKKIFSKIKKITQAVAEQASGSTAEGGGPSWAGQVAVLTGVLAALTGFLTVRSTMLTNEAIYESNQAILSQTQASDAWAEYQANSIKAHIVQMQLLPSSPVNAEDRVDLSKMEKEFRARQPANRQNAQDKAKEREQHLESGQHRLHQKDILGYAGMAAQMAIALASVAALVRRRSVFYIAAAVGVAAVLITAYVFIVDYLA
jgi:hypothetical protein